MTNNAWLKETEAHFLGAYGYRISPRSRSPFGYVFTLATTYLRRDALKPYAKLCNSSLEKILKVLAKFDEQYPLLVRSNRKEDVNKPEEYLIELLSSVGHFNKKTHEHLMHSYGSILLNAKAALSDYSRLLSMLDKKKGRGRAEGQGYFIFQLSHLFTCSSGAHAEEVEWKDVSLLIKYYYALDKQYSCLRHIPNTRKSLATILANYKRLNPGCKCDPEISRYLKNQSKYRCRYKIL